MGIPIHTIKIVGKGMIGLERGEVRVIGNYGMKREFWVFLYFTFGAIAFLHLCSFSWYC
jgi:hypothetical protein